MKLMFDTKIGARIDYNSFLISKYPNRYKDVNSGNYYVAEEPTTKIRDDDGVTQVADPTIGSDTEPDTPVDAEVETKVKAVIRKGGRRKRG